MKLKNSLFLSRANLRGSNRKNTVFIMMILAVVAVILLASFINICSGVIGDLMNNSDAKTLYLDPFQFFPDPDTGYDSDFKNLNDDLAEEVLNMEHVVSVEYAKSAETQLPHIKKITDENGSNITNSLDKSTLKDFEDAIDVQRNDMDLFVKSVDGKNIGEEPVMSCFVPDYVYPYYGGEVDLRWLLGKTITFEYDYSFPSYSDEGIFGYYDDSVEVPVKYDLKVAGLYHFNNENTLGQVFIISPETAQKIENMALENAEENQLSALKTYLNDKYSRRQYIKVDDYENLDEVINKMEDLHLFPSPRRHIEPATRLFVSFFTGSGTFLLTAIIIMMCINIFLSVYSNLNSRHGEIGLMKALGYKTSQIFKSMYIENIIQAIKALLIGGAISAAGALIINAINSNSENLLNHSYIMSWQMFGMMALIACTIILAVPLICHLIMLPKLAKIQPQEAMNS